MPANVTKVMGDILTAFDLPFSARQYLEEFRGVRFRTIVDSLGERHGALDEAGGWLAR